MKRITFLIGCLCAVASGFSQSIDYVEYFFDEDPGRGQGKSFTISPSDEITINEAVPLNELSDGMHTLFLRSRTSNNQWSHAVNRTFVVFRTHASDQVAFVEYFIDEDPGHGNGTEVAFTAAGEVMLDFTTIVIPEGFHNLFIRSRTTSGEWSQTFHQSIVTGLTDLPNLTRVEYYFDDDPGYGLGTAIPFDPIPEQHFSVALDVETLDGGFHQFFLRAQDESGKWSHTYSQSLFLVKISTELVSFEYFLDDDPGLGNGIQLPISSNDFSGSINIDLSDPSIANGMHTLFYRAKDDGGIWSMTSSSSFLKIGTSFLDTPEIVQAEYYISSGDTLTDPGYGAGIAIPIEVGTEVTSNFLVDLGDLQEETYTIVIRAKNSAGDWSQIAYGEFMVNIQDPQTITFTILEDKVYGGGTFLLEATATSELPITYVSSDENVVSVEDNEATVVNAGLATITASQEGDVDYLPAEPVDQPLTVLKAPLEVTADDKTKIYGDANPELTFAYSGFVNGEDATILDEEPIASSSANEQSNVGDYPITLEGGIDDNYEFAPESGTLTVSKAALTATAEDQTINEGDDFPTFTIAYEGFVNDDTEADITPPSATPSVPDSNEPGVFNIELSGGEAMNYELTLVNGVLTIEDVLGLIESDMVTIYPNPVANSFSVKSETEIEQIDIYASNGQLIKSFHQTMETYDISELTGQVFLVNLITKTASSFIRIVKQ